LAGSIPPQFDRVIYDIRDSSSNWLGPKTINRYGRPLDNKGQPKPCFAPLDSQVLGDGIANTTTAPVPGCPTTPVSWVRSGPDGFYSCISPDERSVQLFITGEFRDNSGKIYTQMPVTAAAFRRGI
jgi:hypothetical protein